MAVVFALAAFAVALWVSDGGAAWISPALITLALLAAWSGFGWVSSPPNWIRALILGGLLALLVWIAFQTLAPDSGRFDPTTWLGFGEQGLWPSVLWVVALIAGAAGVVLALVYFFSSVGNGRAAARAVRSWLGWVLVILLAAALLKVGWDGVTGTDAKGDAAWERWLADHTVVRGALIVLVSACVLIPLGELLATALARRRR
jgi:hypothetical protein